MDIEFDPAKDAANIAKHGVSLTRAADLEIFARMQDDRFATALRFRAFGLIDGLPHCLAYSFRGQTLRAISLRRAHLKEFLAHVR